MATEYGGAYGGQPWHSAAPPSGGQPPHRARRGRLGWSAAVAAFVLGAAGLALSLVGVASQLLPRQFTAQQQRQIADWEAGKRWRELPAGGIFPPSVIYPAPVALDDYAGLRLTVSRIGIARQASCTAATDPVAGAVLTRNGCEAMLRATYVDGTDSYVVTVGVAVLPGAAQATAAERELAGAGGGAGVAPGVLTVPFKGTPAAGFSNGRREISASEMAGTYLVFYTIGYADNRSRVPVSADVYAEAEMTSAGQGVAQAVVSVLGAPVPPPHCPGTPGC